MTSFSDQQLAGLTQQVQAALGDFPGHRGGLQLGLILPGGAVRGVGFGWQDADNKVKMTGASWLQHCSLSKTVGACFAIDLLSKRGYRLSTPVNDLLTQLGSPVRLVDAEGVGVGVKGSAGRVRVRHLMNHTGLDVLYV